MLLVSQRIGAPRTEPLLPGSVKRTLDATEGLCSSTVPGGAKRPCLEDVTLAAGPGYELTRFAPEPRVKCHSRASEGGTMDTPYSAALKTNAGPQNINLGATQGSAPHPSVEQELQDILEELTRNPDHSLPELDLEKILGSKGAETVAESGDFGRPLGGGTPTPHQEKQLARDQGFSQSPAACSAQLGPVPQPAPFSLSQPVKPTPPAQAPVCTSMPSGALHSLPSSRWHKVPRPQQLQAPPYRPDKMVSSGRVLPSFSPQSSQANLLPSAAPTPPDQQRPPARGFGPHCRRGSQLLQAGQSAASAESYSFDNTTPLRHYDLNPPAPRPGPMPPGQGYITPGLQPAPPAGSAANTHVLQAQQMQRSVDAGGALPYSRADQIPRAVVGLQDSHAAQQTGYSLLKSQLRKQLLQQVRQRHVGQMTGAQVSDCQQVASCQGMSCPLPPGCGYSMGSPSADSLAVSHNAMLPGRMALPPVGSRGQAGRSVGPFMGNMDSKQVLCHPSQEFGTPPRQGQAVLGVGTPPQQMTPPCQASGRAGMLGVSFGNRSLHQKPRPHTLQRNTVSCEMLRPQQQSYSRPLWQQQQQGCPRMIHDTRVHTGSHQQFYPAGGAGVAASQFSHQPLHASIPSIQQQNGAPASNQILPRLPSRQPGHPSSSDQHSMEYRGLLSTMGAIKQDPSLAMAPPNFHSSCGKHSSSLDYSNGRTGHKLLPCNLSHSPGSSILLGASGGDQGIPQDKATKMAFIDTLVVRSDSWLNNLNTIERYLEQNT